MMKRRLLIVSLLLSLFAAILPSASVFGQACSTPQPTYTPTPGYRATVVSADSTNLLVYYLLNETSGTTANDVSGHSANGTYSGVTLNTTTFLTGDPAASWDGVNDYTNILSSYLTANFNGAEGTVLLWFRVPSGATWTDGALRFAIRLLVDGSNFISMFKQTINNRFDWQYDAGGTLKSVNSTSMGSVTGWAQIALTWSKSSDQVKAFLNGVQVGSTQTGLGTFVGAIAIALIGAANTSGGSPWSGNLSNVAVWKSVLNPTTVAQLATVDPVLTIPPTATICPTYTPTNTPSHTPTFTPTFTYTPNIYSYITVIPPGTSAPGQDVLIIHQITIGQALIDSLLFLLIVFVLLSFGRNQRRGNRGTPSK